MTHGFHRLIVPWCLLFCIVLSARADEAFSEWLKHDQAMQRDTGSTLSVGPFRVTLPMGWIADRDRPENPDDMPGSVHLLYVSQQAGNTNAIPRMTLRSVGVTAGNPDAIGARIAPSRAAGWQSFKTGRFPAYRAVYPYDEDGWTRTVVQIPMTDACLVMELDAPDHAGALPAFAVKLLEAVTHAGSGGVPKPVRGGHLALSRAGGVDAAVPKQAFLKSPFGPTVLRALRKIRSGGDPAERNLVTIIDNGYDALLLRLHLIRNATSSIKLQTFIWETDETGRLLLHELVQAAERGVRVQLIIDHIASFRDAELAAFLATVTPTLRVKHYRPAGKRMDPSPLQEAIDVLIPNKTNQRMHNKLLLVDDVVFVTGGRNIDNKYYNQSTGMNFRDRDILVVGPMATYAAGSFAEYWRFRKSVASIDLKDVRKVIKTGKFKRYHTRADWDLPDWFDGIDREANDTEHILGAFVEPLREVRSALFLADPPGKETRIYTAWRRGTIAKKLEAAMKTAQRSLLIQTPYVVLEGGMLRLFRDLKQQNPGIELAILSNSFAATDNLLTYAANLKMRNVCLEKARLDIYEYMPYPSDLKYYLPNYDVLLERQAATRDKEERPPFLCVHAKSFVVDDRLAYVGSYNFDPRSISLNTEVGLLVEDARFCAALRESIARDMMPTNSWRIAKREEPLSEEEVRRHAPVQRGEIPDALLWPFRYTSSYELKPAFNPVPPVDPAFYAYYRDMGPLPGADYVESARQLLTVMLTTLSGLIIPLL